MASFPNRYKMWLLAAIVSSSTTGCRFLGSVPIEPKAHNVAPELMAANEPQVEVGRPNRFIDTVGNVLGVPSKILLWNWKVDRHRVSDQTLLTLTDYLEFNHLPHVKVRANQYDPLGEWRRLRNNKTVAPGIRYTLGVVSLAQYTLLPGRLLGGDNFNPYTQTINLYSDVPVIALHEGGHAKDFSRREYQGLYSLAYGILPIWHETIATEDVYSYLEATGDESLLAQADRTLYPAYGTYIGNTIGNVSPVHALPIYGGTVLLGHLNGRMLARRRPKSISQSPEIQLTSAQSE